LIRGKTEYFSYFVGPEVSKFGVQQFGVRFLKEKITGQVKSSLSELIYLVNPGFESLWGHRFVKDRQQIVLSGFVYVKD
jgi:hypothetical protein